MRAALVLLVACGASVPERAFAPIEPRARAAHDQGVAMIYDATVCSFTLRDATGTRTIAMPDHTYTYFTNGNILLAVTPLPPGRYTLTGVRIGTITQGHREYGSYGYTDCSDAKPRALDVAIDIAPDALTPLALPSGTLTLAELDQMDASEPNVHAREAAWIPSIDAAKRDLRTKMVAALRQPRDGYDVYRDCGLFGRGTAVVRTTGTPFSFYGHTDDTAAFDAFRGTVPWLGSSQHATGLGGGCVERFSFMAMIADPGELDDAVRKAGAWLVEHDFEGEIDIEVTAVPHEL